jgi:hypothetical protein
LIPDRNKRSFSSPKCVDQLWAYSLSFSVSTGAGVKKPEHEANHSNPFSPKVKNEWNCTLTPSYAFMACTVTTLLYFMTREDFVLSISIIPWWC